MNKVSKQEELAETVRLYEEEQLLMQEIARRLSITRQAVYSRLKKAGVKFRRKQQERTRLDHDDLVRLYVNDGLSTMAVVKHLKVGRKTLLRELERLSIERRPKLFETGDPTPVVNLKVNESTIVRRKGQFAPFYRVAAARKIKISIRRIDQDHVRVTRTE